MIYYFSAFLFYYVFLKHFLQAEQKHQVYLFLMMLPLILMVILRGTVGTDTSVYLQIIEGLSETGVAVSGFAKTPISGWGELTFLVKSLLYFTPNPAVIIVIIASLTTSILIWTASLSTQAKWVFALCIVPIFYLDMTMNGLRYGLAFAICNLQLCHCAFVSRTLDF